jgi:hypothetical protein
VAIPLSFPRKRESRVRGAAEGRDEETSRITQAREGRSKIRIVSEPQAATAPKFQVESPTFSLRTLIKMLVVLHRMPYGISINQKD